MFAPKPPTAHCTKKFSGVAHVDHLGHVVIHGNLQNGTTVDLFKVKTKLLIELIVLKDEGLFKWHGVTPANFEPVRPFN